MSHNLAKLSLAYSLGPVTQLGKSWSGAWLPRTCALDRACRTQTVAQPGFARFAPPKTSANSRIVPPGPPSGVLAGRQHDQLDVRRFVPRCPLPQTVPGRAPGRRRRASDPGAAGRTPPADKG